MAPVVCALYYDLQASTDSEQLGSVGKAVEKNREQLKVPAARPKRTAPVGPREETADTVAAAPVEHSSSNTAKSQSSPTVAIPTPAKSGDVTGHPEKQQKISHGSEAAAAAPEAKAQAAAPSQASSSVFREDPKDAESGVKAEMPEAKAQTEYGDKPVEAKAETGSEKSWVVVEEGEADWSTREEQLPPDDEECESDEEMEYEQVLQEVQKVTETAERLRQELKDSSASDDQEAKRRREEDQDKAVELLMLANRLLQRGVDAEMTHAATSQQPRATQAREYMAEKGYSSFDQVIDGWTLVNHCCQDSHSRNVFVSEPGSRMILHRIDY